MISASPVPGYPSTRDYYNMIGKYLNVISQGFDYFFTITTSTTTATNPTKSSQLPARAFLPNNTLVNGDITGTDPEVPNLETRRKSTIFIIPISVKESTTDSRTATAETTAATSLSASVSAIAASTSARAIVSLPVLDGTYVGSSDQTKSNKACNTAHNNNNNNNKNGSKPTNGYIGYGDESCNNHTKSYYRYLHNINRKSDLPKGTGNKLLKSTSSHYRSRFLSQHVGLNLPSFMWLYCIHILLVLNGQSNYAVAETSHGRCLCFLLHYTHTHTYTHAHERTHTYVDTHTNTHTHIRGGVINSCDVFLPNKVHTLQYIYSSV